MDIRLPILNDHGPTVGPDRLGPAGPAWMIVDLGTTVRGDRWWVIRRRGGRRVRVQVPGWACDPATVRDVIERRVRSLFDPPDTLNN